MPYITKDQVKAKRAALKAALPAYKLSVTTEHYSGIKVAIMAGPTDFGTEYQQLNPYINYREDRYNSNTPFSPSLANPAIQDILDIVMPILNEHSLVFVLEENCGCSILHLNAKQYIYKLLSHFLFQFLQKLKQVTINIKLNFSFLFDFIKSRFKCF